ncbi:GAMYB transcription factor [Parasponia andersonii]|uniref:GAMYB transcription factor n=1 Tax=Parasponia andersonii TaxID=3476 RepID=A0A2P5D412_PARAD|nr:GAMYB transcription factor [Parasponia andersonii]
MVSVNRNPAPAFYFFDPMNMGLPPAAAANTTSFGDDPNKKIRKPYTITKSRESWTDQEHDKFLEALQLFDRDWKKIEAFVGSKTVIQIRSHAQKYFLKVQKSGTTEHVPPPRPKRKAAHPYPQKAPKNAPNVTHVTGPFQSSAASLEPGYIYRPDSSSMLGNPVTGAALPSWSYSSVPPVNVTQVHKDDGRLFVPTVANNSCYSSSTESTPRTKPASEIIDPRVPSKAMRVMPDFAQVYSFIGSVFDANSTGHLQRLKQMDPINLETALLLMRNLSVNLMSPEFEDLRKLLSSYDVDEDMVDKSIGTCNFRFKSENAILSA